MSDSTPSMAIKFPLRLVFDNPKQPNKRSLHLLITHAESRRAANATGAEPFERLVLIEVDMGSKDAERFLPNVWLDLADVALEVANRYNRLLFLTSRASRVKAEHSKEDGRLRNSGPPKPSNSLIFYLPLSRGAASQPRISSSRSFRPRTEPIVEVGSVTVPKSREVARGVIISFSMVLLQKPLFLMPPFGRPSSQWPSFSLRLCGQYQNSCLRRRGILALLGQGDQL
ncbi:hypothetical protein M426DRAFT_264085 [Hypoxylon sp. CI-4A]|nr:hypothetical protein M426DRAFT_264085 [Hypoxylon sp. CI-4A]